MKYIKSFGNHTEYETFTGTTEFILPNVSLCKQENEVHYNPIVMVTGVTLNKSELSLNKGETETLVATVLPSDASNKNVTWSSSNDGVATVSSNGLVTAIGGGNADITVTTEDGGFTAQCVTSIVVPQNVITYTATSKLPQTSYDTSEGITTSAFSGTSGQRLTIVSHTFNGGVGTVTFDDDIAKFGYYAFCNCSGLTSIVIPDSVTNINGRAFYGCKKLTNIDIPNGVTSIGESVFQECYNLTSATIGSGVTSIGKNVFYNCSSLTSCTIGSGVTSIGQSSFYNCRSLTSIVIPDSVTSIGNQAFYSCSSLTSIISNVTTAPTITSATFQNVKTDGTLIVPIGSTGYDTWMGTGNYYLGLYNWTKVEQ